jgi:outer membrane protein assembly factor BamB
MGTVNSTFADVDGMLAAPAGIAASYLTGQKLYLSDPNCLGMPQFLDGTLYTFSHDATYHYMQMIAWEQATGKKLWSTSISDGYYVEPLVSDRKYLFFLNHNILTCLNRTTGATIWKDLPEAASPFPFLALSNIAVHVDPQSHTADRLYVLGEEVRYIYADSVVEEKGEQGVWIFDAATGKSLGRIDWPALTVSANSGQLLCDGETLYASIPELDESTSKSADSKYPAQQSSLAAFDLNTNKMLWKESVDGEAANLVKQGSTLVFIRSSTYADDWIDVWKIGRASNSAKRLWTRKVETILVETTPEKWPITSFAVDSKHVCLQGSKGVLTALDLATGKEIWKQQFASSRTGLVGALVNTLDYGKMIDLNPDMILTTARNVLYVQDGGGLVAALDQATGKELWNKRISKVVWYPSEEGKDGLFVLQPVDKGFYVIFSDGKVDLWK